jgi:hypothetical protein
MRRILVLSVLLVLPLATNRADTLLDFTLTGPSTLAGLSSLISFGTKTPLRGPDLTDSFQRP